MSTPSFFLSLNPRLSSFSASVSAHACLPQPRRWRLNRVHLACITRSEACFIAIFLVSGEKFNDLSRSFLLHMPFFPDFSVYRIGRGCTAAVLLALPDVRHVASHSFGQLVSFFCPRKSRNQWLSRLLLPLTCPSSSISQFSASLLLQLNHDALVALPDVRHVASHAIGQLNFSFRPGKA